MTIQEALTFDDVVLQPAYSEVLPRDVSTQTYVTRSIPLQIPLLSAAMDTVTESRLAIEMAQNGGLGVIHKNMSPQQQAREVWKVKKFVSGVVFGPVTVEKDASLSDALELMRHHKISGIPVVASKGGVLVGILTNRDVRFAHDLSTPVHELMTKENLVTVPPGTSLHTAKNLLHTHRIEKLLVVDEEQRCVGLMTVKDMEKSENYPLASKDQEGRLRVAAALSTGPKEIERAEALLEAGVDVLVVDTAHGHSRQVLDQVRALRALSPDIGLVAGNVAVPDAVRALVECGADGIKIGIGPGSICTTRIVAGVGVPQLSAVMECAEECAALGVPALADGGIKYSGDVAKAIAAGASCVMIGSLFAGCDETPGETFLYQGRSYKGYRGMGSQAAMVRGSSDRYFQGHIESSKFIPEGVEGRVPYKGPVAQVVYQLVGGLRSAMGYTGCAHIKAMQTKCRFRRVTPAGLRESHVHSITVTREAPNYHL